MSERKPHHPAEIQTALKKAVRLEIWSIVWLTSIIVIMGVVAGGSQAFRTAWIEDMLSLLPPVFFLIAHWLEQRPSSEKFPYGYQRAGTLAFFFSAAALAVMGGFLFYEGAKSLIMREHPTLSSWTLFGHQVWLGWLMIAALIYSVIPPVILGRMKRKAAAKLHDKVLYTDAEMNAADWQTGVAGAAGIAGVALGWWWADAAAALLISLSILRDGINGLRLSIVALLDGAPRKLESGAIDADAQRIRRALEDRYRDVHVQMRETGRYMRVNIEPAEQHHVPEHIADPLMEKDSWRLLDVSVALRSGLPPDSGDADPET